MDDTQTPATAIEIAEALSLSKATEFKPYALTIRRMASELDRLRAIVGKLPVDAEGVAITLDRVVVLRHNTVIKSGSVDLHIHGTKAYIVANVAIDGILLFGEHHGMYGIAKPSDCYGSIETAEAAKEIQ